MINNNDLAYFRIESDSLFHNKNIDINVDILYNFSRPTVLYCLFIFFSFLIDLFYHYSYHLLSSL